MDLSPVVLLTVDCLLWPDMDYLSILFQSAQTVGAVLIAVLLWPVVRVIRERYLEYWAWGWALLAVALVALFFSFQYPDAAGPLRVVYCLGEYGFGFLLWVGSRTYTTGRTVRRSVLYWLLPLIGYGTLAPFLFESFSHLFGWHAAIMAAFFTASLWETRRFSHPGQTAIGSRVYQGTLLGLAVLFTHYAVLLICHQFFFPPDYRYPHLPLSSLYDMVLEATLALGMITIATERMRAELINSNSKLASAVAELEQVSRTDPLTGLLNRRGLDDILAQPAKLMAGCVAMIDVNDLKPLNDQYGHEAGDIALQLLARALRNLFRVTDPLFRLGGDEFLVLMPGGTQDEITRRMESLDRGLLGQRVSASRDPVHIRISWGVAAYTEGSKLTAALKVADDAMYIQKRQRKNGDSR
jgi:diguanylate cyclase (GGDEF)-like protein